MAALSVVVIPARDEQDRIAACIAAFSAQTVQMGGFEVILVADACEDRTEALAVQTAAALGVNLSVLHGSGEGPGFARRLGMDRAAERLESFGLPDGLIATTDADTRPAPDWLERQLRHVARGAQVIAGMIELDPTEAAALPKIVRRQRERDARRQLQGLREIDPGVGHHDFGGASIGVTLSAYRRVGGLPLIAELEDEAFALKLLGHGVTITRPIDVRVQTAARTHGRARRGLSVDLAVSSWLARRRYAADEFRPAQLRGLKGSSSISVVILSRHSTSAGTDLAEGALQSLAPLDLIDELIVIDRERDDLLAQFGPTLGKGDAIWRALQSTRGEILCFVDADAAEPQPRHLLGLLGPLLTDRSVALVNASFTPEVNAEQTPSLEGRAALAELTARPLLNLHFPLLAGLSQPLAEVFAARRGLLEGLAFPVGDGVEIALLIDALEIAGLDALAETRLGTRPRTAQPPTSPGEAAFAIAAAVEQRLDGTRSATGGHYLRPWEGGALRRVPILERPAVADLLRADAMLRTAS